METTETKLKLESEVNALKREYKTLHSQVATLKNEYTTLVEMNEKQTLFKDEQDLYLKEVLNDIANAKVEWMHEKEAELVDIAKKKEEISDIISKKSDIDKQEKKITTLLDKNTSILNEKKTLELELKSKLVEIESQNKALDTKKADILKIERSVEDKIQEFKDKVKKIISEINL